MDKNPAYVAMTTDKNLRPQSDEDIPAEHPYESPADMENLRDIAASSPSDEHTLEVHHTSEPHQSGQANLIPSFASPPASF